MTLLGFNINFANAALTTVTANTIQGTKPILVKTGTTTEASLNDIVSVIMPDGTTILSPGGMITYTVAATDKLADIKPYIAYLDIDGDLGDSNHRLQGVDGISSVTYIWKDKNNRVVTDILEAFAECLSPYTLTVYANNAQAVSSYGDPLSKTYVGTLSETYTITVPAGSGGCIKHIQPASMHVHTGKDSYEIKFPDGYNTTVWDSGVISGNLQIGGGFKINSGFPTTGFDKASFNLIGADSDQRNYRCTKLNTETRITLSGGASSTLGENCKITYDVATKSDFVLGGTPTINMEYSIDGITWTPIDSYTIPTPNKWATGPRQRLEYNTLFDFAGGYPAAIACGARSTLFGISDMTEAASYFFDRADFTNAPNLSGSLDELANLATQTFGRIKNKQISVEPIEQNALTLDTLGKWIYMEPAQPKKVLYIQFPIENNLSEFANKSDEYIGYMISNRSENTLFDSLQKQGLIESISASANPTRYGNSGVFSIYATLTDKGLLHKDLVLANVFSYLDLLEQQGVSQNYYDEIQKALALDFKFPDITRDMSYVEWLSDQMLFYPTEHILDAEYIATYFDENAIKQRLKSLTLDQARIWVIASNQPTDKTAYFVDAPYRIEAITQSQHDNIMNKVDEIKLQLPELNPYLPTQFIIPKIKMQSNKHNEFSSTGNHLHFSTNHFADEPKAAIALSLRNNSALSTAKDQVMFSLLDYLANRELAEFRFQTNVAGINVSTQADSGLMITASGFNQYLTDAVKQVVNTYQTFDIDEEGLALAKSSYLEKLDAADHTKSFQLALQPVYALSNNFYTDRNERRKIVSSITVQDLEQYRKNLFYNTVPYMLTVGNLYYTKSYDLYRQIKDELNAKNHYEPEQVIKIENQTNAIITQKAVSTDNALLMSFVPSDYDKITGRVSSYLLYKIISPWFYDQLRSQEQLGYAVFALPVYIGDSSGIGFLIQSNEYEPAHLNERYQAFYPIILNKLNALTDEEFEQYKQAVINELLMPPQTLDEEFGNYLADFRESLFDFDSKQKKVEQLNRLTRQDIITFFIRSVIERDGLVLASQVVGNQPEKTINQVKGLKVYKGATELQQQLSKQ